MKRITILLLFIFAGSAVGQTAGKLDSKIAVLDSDRLFDRTRGVSKLIAGYQLACCPYTAFSMGGRSRKQQQISDLEEQIEKSKASHTPTIDKDTQLAELKRQYKRLEDAEKAEYEKRYREVVSPVFEQIRSLLKEYAAKNGFDLVLDEKLILDGEILTDTSNFPNITDDFIAYCNSVFAKQQ